MPNTTQTNNLASPMYLENKRNAYYCLVVYVEKTRQKDRVDRDLVSEQCRVFAMSVFD